MREDEGNTPRLTQGISENTLPHSERFMPDDTATPDDIAAIQAARAEYARGETVTHDAIDWD